MSSLASAHPVRDMNFRKILGLDFFGGTAEEAILRMRDGGLLVVPAAPALVDLGTSEGYREALLNADLCIADSGFMVLTWNLFEGDRLHRLSGLEYLRALLQQDGVANAGNTFWVMASQRSAEINLRYLASLKIEVPKENVYLAPMYGREIQDEALLRRLLELRPKNVIVTVGGGTQERLGLYLKRNLDYMPAIHCIGAAIGFLSGDQVLIPDWADLHYLGWVFRCFSEPARFIPRYWEARKLFSLMFRYRSELPPVAS